MSCLVSQPSLLWVLYALQTVFLHSTLLSVAQNSFSRSIFIQSVTLSNNVIFGLPLFPVPDKVAGTARMSVSKQLYLITYEAQLGKRRSLSDFIVAIVDSGLYTWEQISWQSGFFENQLFVSAHLHVEASSCCRQLSVHPSVCLSVCQSNAWIVTKLTEVLPTFLYCMKGKFI